VAHIERRGKNRWRARYIGTDRKEHSRTFPRRVDAERFLATVESEKLRGEWIDPRLGRVTFAEWVDRWRGTAIHLKPKTVEGYESLLRCHLLPEFGTLPLAGITTPRVKSWVATLTAKNLSASRIRNAYRLFSMILKAAVDSGYLPRTPCVGIKLPRLVARDMLILNSEQVAILAGKIEEPYGTLVYVLAYGGLRWGEACALRRGRCDIARSRLEIMESLSDVNGQLHFGPTKTYSRRSARLPRFVSELLAEHIVRYTDERSDALVFTAPEGGPLRGPNFRQRMWAPALEAAGLPGSLRIHDLRHTCASLLIQSGASVTAVSQQLGHSTPTVTLDVYSHLFDDDLDRLYEDVDADYGRAVGRAKRDAVTAWPRPGHMKGLGDRATVIRNDEIKSIDAAPPVGVEPTTPGLGNQCEFGASVRSDRRRCLRAGVTLVAGCGGCSMSYGPTRDADGTPGRGRSLVLKPGDMCVAGKSALQEGVS
jgi:integrase